MSAARGRHQWLIRSITASLAATAALLVPAAAPRAASSPSPCAPRPETPLWIDYGDGLTSDVRDVFAQPEVIVSSAGKAGSAYFRAHGAATTYFELHLPQLVGQPSDPADPNSIPAAAAKLLAQAVASADCSTPEIALNELFGSNLAAPWSATNTVYRSDVLALIQQLAAGGAHPVLLVHGDYTVAGSETAAWWQQVAQAGEIVYEAYYDGNRITALGPLLGNRRMRQGMRQVVIDFGAIGIPPSRLGVMLGFHTGIQPGAGGRQGLQPPQAWFRVVKWEALDARQVAAETGIASVWSWGWANFSGTDPDKAAAACVYLWARDPYLCDGSTVAGPAFNTSRSEGQIVLPPGIQCSLADHRITTASVQRLAALTGDSHEALTALFARASLETAARVTAPKVLAIEQRAINRAFHGNRSAYVRALARRHATIAIARAIIVDELRRRGLARILAGTSPGESVLQWTDDREAKAADTAICLHDALPGTSDFPTSEAIEIGVVPLPALLPFVFADRAAPAPPTAVAATASPGSVALSWSYGNEPDLAGYQVLRALTAAGPFTPLNKALLDRPSFVDNSPPAGVIPAYEVRAIDTSGNLSAPSAPVSAPAAPSPAPTG